MQGWLAHKRVTAMIAVTKKKIKDVGRIPLKNKMGLVPED